MDSLETLSGKTYKNVRITGIKADSLRISHEAGAAGIPKDELPKSIVEGTEFPVTAQPSGIGKNANSSSSKEAAKARKIQSIDDAVECCVYARGETGSGSGFLCRTGNWVYIYTNAHVGAIPGVRFFDSRDREIPIKTAKVVPEIGVDLVRFMVAVRVAKYLELATPAEVAESRGKDVVALGNTDGAGVIRPLHGKIVGLGPKKVEVTCEFQGGNSGGPIVDPETLKVVGVVTYMTSNTDIWHRDTEVQVRRFGWIPSAFNVWQTQTRKDLAHEQHIIETIKRTTRLLYAITFFLPTSNGFQIHPATTLEAEYTIGSILQESENHPCFKRALQVEESIVGSNIKPSQTAIVGLYKRYYGYALNHSKNEIITARKRVLSGYGKQDLKAVLRQRAAIVREFEKLSRQIASRVR